MGPVNTLSQPSQSNVVNTNRAGNEDANPATIEELRAMREEMTEWQRELEVNLSVGKVR
jgi:hypothetical protein